MTSEGTKGQVVKPDPEQTKFQKKVVGWLDGKNDFDEVKKAYPTPLLKPHQRVVRHIDKMLRVVE